MSNLKHQNARYVFKRDFRVLRIFTDTVLISYLGRRNWLRAKGIEIFFEKLMAFGPDGFDLEGLESLLTPAMNPPEIHSFLKELLAAGFLTSTLNETTIPPAEVPAFFERFSSDKHEQYRMFSALASVKLRIVSSIELPTQWMLSPPWFKSVERAADIGDEAGDPLSILTIVIFEEKDLWFTSKINERALQQNRLVLPAAIDAFGCIVGPAIGIPGQPCLNCLQLRRRSTQRGAYFYDPAPPKSALARDDLSWPSYYWTKLEGLLLSEAVNLVSRCVPALSWKNGLIQDFLNHRSVNEEMFRVPGCTACQHREFKNELAPS